MTVKIATVSTPGEAADLVVLIWRDAGKSKLLRFEGFDGVGKSGLAKLIAQRIDAEHVEGDRFTFKPAAPTPYAGCVRQAEFNAAIEAAFASGKSVALDAVCLDGIARAKLEVGARVRRLREAAVLQQSRPNLAPRPSPRRRGSRARGAPQHFFVPPKIKAT